MASVTVTAKRPSGPKKPRAHPPYLEMIKEAIMALKERTGSSQYAIAKFIEQRQNDLPSNFKRLLLVQLKKLVASGKIVKVKNSFKLAVPVKPVATAVKKSPKEAVAAKKAASKPKTGRSTKSQVATPAKAKKVAAKPKAVAKPKKAAKTVTITSPRKKAGAPAKVTKAPVKAAKKPKSIKSPAKKATAKRGRK